MSGDGAPSGKAISLDHVGVVGNDLAALAALYERLGFALTPRALAGDGRIENRCVMLRQGYLELMALTPGGQSATLARMLDRYAGAHIIALAVDDAAASVARLRRAGFDCPGAEQSVRAIDASDPGGPAAHFEHLPVQAQPEARINLIRHLTPEAMWQERFLNHPNRVVALEAVALRIDAPAETAARFSRLSGRPVVPDPDGGYALVLPHGRIRLLPADKTRWQPTAVPSIAAITLHTDDVGAAIARKLTAASIAHDVDDGAIITRAEASGGVELCFT